MLDNIRHPGSCRSADPHADFVLSITVDHPNGWPDAGLDGSLTEGAEDRLGGALQFMRGMAKVEGEERVSDIEHRNLVVVLQNGFTFDPLPSDLRHFIQYPGNFVALWLGFGNRQDSSDASPQLLILDLRLWTSLLYGGEYHPVHIGRKSVSQVPGLPVSALSGPSAQVVERGLRRVCRAISEEARPVRLTDFARVVLLLKDIAVHTEVERELLHELRTRETFRHQLLGSPIIRVHDVEHLESLMRNVQEVRFRPEADVELLNPSGHFFLHPDYVVSAVRDGGKDEGNAVENEILDTSDDLGLYSWIDVVEVVNHNRLLLLQESLSGSTAIGSSPRNLSPSGGSGSRLSFQPDARHSTINSRTGGVGARAVAIHHQSAVREQLKIITDRLPEGFYGINRPTSQPRGFWKIVPQENCLPRLRRTAYRQDRRFRAICVMLHCALKSLILTCDICQHRLSAWHKYFPHFVSHAGSLPITAAMTRPSEQGVSARRHTVRCFNGNNRHLLSRKFACFPGFLAPPPVQPEGKHNDHRAP